MLKKMVVRHQKLCRTRSPFKSGNSGHVSAAQVPVVPIFTKPIIKFSPQPRGETNDVNGSRNRRNSIFYKETRGQIVMQANLRYLNDICHRNKFGEFIAGINWRQDLETVRIRQLTPLIEV